MNRIYLAARKEFWAHKQAEAERTARMDKWEQWIGRPLYAEVLRKR